MRQLPDPNLTVIAPPCIEPSHCSPSVDLIDWVAQKPREEGKLQEKRPTPSCASCCSAILQESYHLPISGFNRANLRQAVPQVNPRKGDPGVCLVESRKKTFSQIMSQTVEK